MTDQVAKLGFWDDKFQTQRLLKQVQHCMDYHHRLNQSEYLFIKSMDDRIREREELTALTGYQWVPSTAQLNYLNSCYDKVSR